MDVRRGYLYSHLKTVWQVLEATALLMELTQKTYEPLSSYDSVMDPQ